MVALLLAVLLQSAEPVSAASPSAPPAKAAKPVCRKETVVGSTIKKKVCPRKPPEMAHDAGAEAAQVAARDGR